MAGALHSAGGGVLRRDKDFNFSSKMATKNKKNNSAGQLSSRLLLLVMNLIAAYTQLQMTKKDFFFFVR